MSDWQGFYYPEVAEADIARGLYLTSIGRILYPPAAGYPTPGHPPEYQLKQKSGRRLGDFALLWIEEGEGQVQTASLGRMPLLPGNVLLLPPGAWHRYRPDTAVGWVERWLCANGSSLHRLSDNNAFPTSPEVRLIQDCEALNSAFDRLEEHAKRNSLLVSALALTVIALALGETDNLPATGHSEPESCDGIVDAAIRFIWTNCHRVLGVNDIAKHVGISRRMLERRFAQTWPRSVAHELSLARVHRGRELLSEKVLTVKEAGYAAGFGGSRRFISAHRRIFGTTPGLARRQAARSG